MSDTVNTSARPPRKRRVLRTFLWLVAVLILLPAAILVLLPPLVSLGPVRQLLVRRAEQAAGATVEVADWRVAWVGGLRASGLRYEDTPGGIAVRVREIRAGAGLLDLWRSRGDFRTLEIVEPTLTLAPPSGTKPAPPETSTAEPGGAASGWQPRGTIRVTDGSLSVRVPGADQDYALKQVNATLSLAGPERPASLEVSAGNEVAAKGTYDARTGKADLALDLSDVALDPFSALAARLTNAPRVAGLLSASVTAGRSGPDDLRAAGRVSVRALKIAGGPLGADTPSLDSVSLEFDVSRKGNGVSVRKARVASPALEASIAGELTPAEGRYPSGTIQATAKIDVAEIARQIPRTLGIRPGLKVESGSVVFDARAMAATGTLDFAAHAETRDVAAVLDGRRLTLDAPVSLAAAGFANEKGATLRRLDLASSFATASGSGTVDNAAADLTVDLAAALREAGKFVDLRGLAATGAVTTSVRIQSESPVSKRFTSRTSARGLRLAGLTPRPLTLAALDIEKSSLVELAEDRSPKAFRDVSTTVRSDVLRGRLSADALVPRGEETPDLQGGKITAEGNLGRLLEFYEAVSGTNLPVKALGDATVAAAFEAQEGRVAVPSFALAVTNLTVKKDGRSHVEESVRIQGAGRMESGAASVVLDSVKVASGLLDLECSGTVGAAASNLTVALAGTLACDFARADSVVNLFTGERYGMAGRSQKPFRVQADLSARTLAAALAATDAEAAFHLDRARLFGVDVTSLETGVRVKDGVARLDAAGALNEGKLAAAPFLDARAEPAFVGLPEKSAILRDARLNEQVTTGLLARIHPLFRDCAAPAGRVSLSLDRCRVPLEEKMAQKMSLAGRVGLKGVVLVPGGVLATVLNAVKLQDATAKVPDQDIEFTCRDGRIGTTPLKLVSGGHTLVVSGTMGVDGTLDYVAEVPITRDMVSPEIYEYVKDTRVKILIGGTASRPEISRKSLDATLGEAAKRAAKKVLTDESARKALLEQGGKALDKILKDKKIKF